MGGAMKYYQAMKYLGPCGLLGYKFFFEKILKPSGPPPPTYLMYAPIDGYRFFHFHRKKFQIISAIFGHKNVFSIQVSKIFFSANKFITGRTLSRAYRSFHACFDQTIFDVMKMDLNFLSVKNKCQIQIFCCKNLY